MRLGTLCKSLTLCLIPIQAVAEMSYSEFALLVDNSKIIGKHLAAIDVCKRVLEESSMLRIQIPLQAMMQSLSYDEDLSADMIRGEVIASLEKVETDFELISKIDAALTETREVQFSEWYVSIAQLSSIEAYQIDKTAIETAGSFCLNVLHAGGLIMSAAKSARDGSTDAPESAGEVIQTYSDLSPFTQ